MIRSLFRVLPTSMGGILNAVAAVYFLQKGGAWIWLGLAHLGMVVLLGVISAKKAKLAQAEQGARSDGPSSPTAIGDAGKENR